MYNRLFTKILDSSIWLEEDTTRIVWITLLAAMDEDGFCAFSCTENLSRRANVTIEKVVEALKVLESPDPRNPDDDCEGRRIEKVPNGWLVLKAPVYRSMMSREIQREQTRVRVAEHRAKNKTVTNETLPNVTVTKVTPQSKAEQSTIKANQNTPKPPKGDVVVFPENLRSLKFQEMWKDWETFRRERKKPLTAIGRKQQLKNLSDWGEERAVAAIEHTIFKGWDGLREPNENNGSNKGKPPLPAVLTGDDYEREEKRLNEIRQNATNRAANS